jgi:hypothetical protein
VGNCFEFGIEPLGSIRCWETIEFPNNFGIVILSEICCLLSVGRPF